MIVRLVALVSAFCWIAWLAGNLLAEVTGAIF